MNLVLRFVDGKFKGGEFPLKPNREIIIGRSSEYDMVLEEDMVSRQHAKITTFHNQVILIDLGSTNGTQVNGHDITEQRLKAGDVVTVGRSVMKVVDIGVARPRAANLQAQAKGGVDASRMTMQGARLAGSYPDEGVKVSGLIKQLLRMRKATSLRLTVGGCSDVITLTAQGGHLLTATLTSEDNAVASSDRKALYRAMTWRSGTFSFDPVGDDAALTPSLPKDIAALIAEARAQRSELDEYRDLCPPMAAGLELNIPLEPRLSDLSPEALDTLQLAINQPTVKAVIDGSNATDLDVWKDVLYLLQSHFVRVVE